MRRAELKELSADPEIVDAIRTFLDEAKARHGDRIERVVLYGSVARGEADETSDVDLLVLWRGRDWDGTRKLARVTTEILQETGVDLSARAVSPDRWQRLEDLDASFLRNVEREGLVVSG